MLYNIWILCYTILYNNFFNLIFFVPKTFLNQNWTQNKENNQHKNFVHYFVVIYFFLNLSSFAPKSFLNYNWIILHFFNHNVHWTTSWKVCCEIWHAEIDMQLLFLWNRSCIVRPVYESLCSKNVLKTEQLYNIIRPGTVTTRKKRQLKINDRQTIANCWDVFELDPTIIRYNMVNYTVLRVRAIKTNSIPQLFRLMKIKLQFFGINANN